MQGHRGHEMKRTRLQKGVVFRRLFCLVAAFALLCAVSEAAPKTRTEQEENLISVSAEGFAPIKDGNKNAAREAARRSAYRDALEKALGAYVEGITRMQNYEVVQDKVFSQTSGVVKDFEIVSEKVDEDGILYISARCGVSAVALDGVLGPAMIDALGNPRVMVLIDERIGDRTPFLSTTEGEVLRVFEKAGYLIVDPSQAEALKNIDLAAARKSENPDLLRDVARTFQADVLIAGKACGSSFTRQKVSGVNIHGVRSTVQLRAVLANSAYMLGSDMIEEKTKGISEEDGAIKGFQAGGAKAGRSLVHKVAYALVSGSAGSIPGRTVKIKIADISFRNAKSLKDSLEGIDGVTGVYQRLFRNRNLELDVVSDRTAEDLASLISDLGVEVEDITSATVEGRSGGEN
jgi:hypothetical protein